MLRILSSARGIALYLLVWILLGLVFAGMIVSVENVGVGSASQTQIAHWPNAILFALPMCLLYAFATGFSALAMCRSLPLGTHRISAIFTFFAGAAMSMALLWLALGYLWNEILLALQYPWAGLYFSSNLSWLILALGILLYGLMVTLHYLWIEYERAQQAAQREMASKMMAQEAELRMLRTQIDPHFLFNSLNSISALTSIDASKARLMTQRLADFFRHSLSLEAHKKVSLEQEMQLIRHFLEIEQVRFGPRLQIQIELSSEAAACLLPPMLIQPLVENAVKHGIGNLIEGGKISIQAQRAGSLLRITIDNAIDVDAPTSRGNGIGLANVQQRLANSYAHQASLHWQRQEQQFHVEVCLPAETAAT